jgi:hypothetical protein
MDHFLVAELIWAASFVGHVVLSAILLLRRRWKQYPVFTGYVVFHALETAILFTLYKFHYFPWYTKVYWTGAVIDFLFQLGIIYEIARIVMKPTGTWVRDARNQFLLAGGAGLLLAGGLTWWLTPPGVHGPALLEMRGNLFASFLICELFLILSSTSRKLGLGWRNHVLAITQGFGIWIIVILLTESLQSYFGHSRHFALLEYAHQFVSIGVLGYWTVQMWREEPVRRPISAELQQYIVALHQRVGYDLGKFDV